MSPALKKILVISAKHAVNALLVNTGAWLGDPRTFNFSSVQGWEHVGRLALWVVASKEATVWIPKLIKWSQSTGE